MRITLNKYIARIDALYQRTRAEYEKIMDSMTLSTELHNAKMRELNTFGRNNELERYQTEQGELKDRLQTVRQNFNLEYSKIRAEVASVFRSLFVMDGKQVDTGVIALMDSGIVTDTELIEMANNYREQGNRTMVRVLARYAGERADGMPDKLPLSREMHHLASMAKDASERDDLEVIDTMKKICDMGLRDDRLLADGTHNRVYDINVYLDAGNEIGIDVASPFSE